MREFQLKPLRLQPPEALIPFLPRWQSNNSPEDLGIVRFAFECFPNTFKREYGVAGWVRPALYETLRYNPKMKKIDRSHAICTYRDGSKSTWFGKILPLYAILVGQYGIYCKDYLLPEMDYIRLRAKTQEKAEEKMGNISKELLNQNIIQLFGDLQPSFKEVKDKKLKNQTKLMILRNGYILQAQGLNMPSRGANIWDRRPKLDIDDDVENKENTKTPEQRLYNAKEVLGEQFGGLADDGMTIYIGNFVHQECLMAKLLKNEGWKRQFYQITRFDPVTGEEIADWPQRFPVNEVRRLGKWYENQPELGGWQIFRMEYYNEIVTDKQYKINLVPIKYEYKNGHNWIILHDSFGRPKYYACYIVVSIDPAISAKSKTSDGCVTVTAFCSDKKRRVVDCVSGKLDILDRYYEEQKRPRVLATTPEEMANVSRRGGASEACRKVLQYHADAFVVENAGQQLAWFNDITEILGRLGIAIPGLPYHPKDEKVYKLETGLLNLFAADLYEINSEMAMATAIKTQITTFPENKMDILDALFNAEQMGRFPQDISLDSLGNTVDSSKNKEYDLSGYSEAEPWIIF